MWRQAKRRPGSRAIGAAPPVEANAHPSPAWQGERQERQRGSPKTPHPQGARSAGKSATLENPAHLGRAGRSALAQAIVTSRPRRQGRLGGANPRRRVGGIERGAGLPAGAPTCKNTNLSCYVNVAVLDPQAYDHRTQIKLACLSQAVAVPDRDTMDKTKRC